MSHESVFVCNLCFIPEEDDSEDSVNMSITISDICKMIKSFKPDLTIDSDKIAFGINAGIIYTHVLMVLLYNVRNIFNALLCISKTRLILSLTNNLL